MEKFPHSTPPPSRWCHDLHRELRVPFYRIDEFTGFVGVLNPSKIAEGFPLVEITDPPARASEGKINSRTTLEHP